MRFEKAYPLAKLIPAEYNPRSIDDASLEQLKESIRRFGVVKPVIVNGDRIAAGHQRVKVLQSMGVESVPAIILKRVARPDEIMFNLLHNRVETSVTEVVVQGADALKPGFSLVRYHRIHIPKGNQNILVVAEMAKMILRYGLWGCVIIDRDGKVFNNSDYAVAARPVRKDLLVYKIETGADELKALLQQDYGVYDYKHLNIPSYNQYYCQMHRLVPGAKRQNKSGVYEQIVKPSLSKHQRLVDFGAGRCAYVERLQRLGFKALPYEPHYVGSQNKIDLNRVKRFIADIEKDIRQHGLFDVVVLDSVLNSITSLEFEKHVLTTVNALMGQDGTCYIGTRNLEKQMKTERRKTSIRSVRKWNLRFLDENGFTGAIRNGVWTMQRFHSIASLKSVLERYFGEVNVFKGHNSDLLAICKQPKRLSEAEYRESLEIEFNMEYKDGTRLNVHKGLVKAILKRLI